ncbi:DUF6879 family protein [Actinoallomurus acaciae]|uniref:DUF6879 family protein n=1 Tax=Actinoallomurus acaciae TaxID=502577 RepID=A0ABV5Y7H2_9ACTN
MLERVAELIGQELKLDEYFEDFDARFWQVDSSWKLERRQVFQEPDVPSWGAMAMGDRERSLALADEMRDGIAEHQRRLDAQGIIQRRLRIVELPLSDYLWWELYVLRIRADLGERIRVLSPSAVASWETSGSLPEIILLGRHTTYQVRYDQDGIVTGAKLLADPEITTACRAEMAALWEKGEDLASFLTRTGVPADTREPS